MADTLEAVEEIILLTLQNSLTDELNGVIDEINSEKGYEWVEKLEEVAIGEEDLSFKRKPCGVITIKKSKNTVKDSIIDAGEYIVNLRISLRESEIFAAYRYAAAIMNMIKKSSLLPSIADRVMLEELEYYTGRDNGTGESDEAEYRIRVVREGF